MAGWGAKTVRLEKVAEGIADRATEEFPRFEDAFFALQWLLARRAGTLGIARHDSEENERVYVQAGDEVAGTPDIWVLFSDRPNDVIIWDLQIVRSEEITD